MNKSHRGTIFVEDAPILSHTAHPGDQHILRVQAPQCAAHARPGCFAHLQCDPQLPMRRPLSLMRVDPHEGWVEFLYKAVGKGTRLLARRQVGEKINLMGPIGKPFTLPHGDRPRALLLGGGVGIPPMVFLADAMRRDPVSEPFVIMGSEVPFPFKASPSRILVPGMPDGVIAAMPLLEDWGVPSRLTSLAGFPGCHEGYVTDLARHWLDALSPEQRRQVQVYACGPHAMLDACAALAREYHLPCQVSLEEYMACAVGGCAGCVVKVQTDQGSNMKRVCVDGPVFEAESVFG
ncbi:dihydroorotate dehydrogenase electron transfer subunit [Ectothiorhodospira shaposhnikovii]|uniref:dihydroorotate dehydrogenase electron transfer subunit n=1 Tax=Ectothiorhodospira shaposhnikovii TaxID=1054 RepID=UPI001EE937E6|nr:dihydroorotate dehydrogenase electron transfer subunit [Ectothiorhodospira shaposhnikovii]MCG5512289.1 dihydroorotate dehydrogenase electron transfer subunit [Ectothiorhodospira shaposhnikovii]